VGTVTEGIFKLESHDGKVLNYTHREGDNSSISSDYIMDIVEGESGITHLSIEGRFMLGCLFSASYCDGSWVS